MSIDLRNENLLDLKQAARTLPLSHSGKPVSISCVYRWVLVGVKTPAGRVRLEALRMGGRWLTSAEALERFAARLTPNLDQPAPMPRSSGVIQRKAERAGAQLEKLGI